MSILQLYNDQNCTDLYRSIKVLELNNSKIGWYNGEPTMPSTMTLGDKEYSYYDNSLSYGCAVQGFGSLNGMPMLSPVMTPFTPKTVYCKNGFSMEIGILSDSTVVFRSFRYGGRDISVTQDYTSHPGGGVDPYFYAIGFKGTDDKRYIGFTRVWISSAHTPDALGPICGFERSFWDSAFQPPYDYGTKPDAEGGEGTGAIPHTPIGFSSKPTISLPTGEHGLHAYRIDSFAYDDLQAYLWGQGSTLAKNLWQKFVNSKTNPSACVVACYRLPRLFMPSGTVTDGIKIAGVKMPRGVGIIQEVSLGFVDKFVYIGHVEAPFKSWADYCGASVLISIPVCGEFTAPLEKVWDFDIFVKYRIDLSNGNIVGMACAGTWAGDDGSLSTMNYLLGEMSGNVAYNVPISGGDDGTLARIGAVFGGISNVVSGFVGGVQDLSSVVGAMAAGSAGSAGFSSVSRTGAMASRGAHYLSDIIMPPFQTHVINANLSGNMSACSNGIAYVEYQIARFAYPSNYGNIMGYPARSSSGRLRDFQNGYGEFYVSADFDIHGATYEEKEEIVALLESGVFV